MAGQQGCRRRQVSEGTPLSMSSMTQSVRAVYFPCVAFLVLSAFVECVPGSLDGSSQGYLVPLLPWGLNNQVAGFKEVMVLAKLLNRTVVVMDLTLPEYKLDTALDTESRHIIFSDIFNTSIVSQFVPAVPMQQLVQQGWDRRLDAALRIGPRLSLTRLKQVQSLHNITSAAHLFVEQREWHCTESDLQQLAEKLAPYKSVGVMACENIVKECARGAQPDLSQNSPGQICLDLYINASAHMERSLPFKAMAKQLVAGQLHGEPYLAVHIRPYPDTCLELWAEPVFNVTKAVTKCTNGNLVHEYVNQTQEIMALHDLRRLFVMCHPYISDAVDAAYRAVGLEPQHMGLDAMFNMTGRRSASLLAMLEQEVATQATVFLGTPQSSISTMIVQERVWSMGLPANVSLHFVRTKTIKPPPSRSSRATHLSTNATHATTRAATHVAAPAHTAPVTATAADAAAATHAAASVHAAVDAAAVDVKSGQAAAHGVSRALLVFSRDSH